MKENTAAQMAMEEEKRYMEECEETKEGDVKH